MKIIRLFLIVSAVVLGSCVEQNVRLYVKVDDSCASCCDDVDFSIRLNDREETRIGVSEETLIERPITTSVFLGILAGADDPESEKTDQCRNCVVSRLNRTLLLQKKGNDPGPYVFYNLVFFENEDIHINLRCVE